MDNKGSKQVTEPQEKSSQHFQNSREVFDQQCEDTSCKRTQQRIKKLEFSFRLLIGLFLGHLLGELISAVLLH